MDNIWKTKFSDVERKNDIIIRWKGRWKNKFGHIKRLKNKDSEIGINALFKDEKIPEYIIELTIAHELVHYMHGFNSPHPRMFKHPHKGNIVNKELKKRGYFKEIKMERIWFKNVWLKMHNHTLPEKGKITIRQLRNTFRFF